MRECRQVFVGREKAQFGTSSTGPILLTLSVLLTLLAYDFFLNF
jgi:hypothetical protein